MKEKINFILMIFVIFFVSLKGNVLAAETMDIILQRKSVRNYIDKKVTKGQLDNLMRAGMAAPTAIDSRPWAFVAVTDRKKLDKLSVMPYCGMLKYASAAILVCGDSSKFIQGPYQDFWIQDCSAATQNILLAAEDMGLGAVWLGGHPVLDRMDLMRQVLEVPEGIIPFSLISIGYPAGTERPKDKYTKDNIHWEKW